MNMNIESIPKSTDTLPHKIHNYFTDTRIADLLLQQLAEVQGSTGYNLCSVNVEGYHLYVYLARDQHRQQEIEQHRRNGEMACMYVVRVGRGFPLSGVRLHMLGSPYQPRVFDCRDLVREVLGSHWDHTCRLAHLVRKLSDFSLKLSLRNGIPLAMQQTGQFVLGDMYTHHELTKFASMDIFEDLNQENSALIATTDTHLLTFKLHPSRQKSQFKQYQLGRVCELQCISDLLHNQKTGDIIITMCKYRTVKGFNQFQKISKKYRLAEADDFIRNVLKCIGKFQRVDMRLQLASSAGRGDAEEEKAKAKVEAVEQMEANLVKAAGQERQKIEAELVKGYHRLINYFSERAISYYLIFVNKLNNICSKNQASKG